MSYESPITVCMRELETEIDSEVMTAVQRFYVDIDREELSRALFYNRNQYDKGFRDGVSYASAENTGEWLPGVCPGKAWYDLCSKCGSHSFKGYAYCPNCGALNAPENLPFKEGA